MVKCGVGRQWRANREGDGRQLMAALEGGSNVLEKAGEVGLFSSSVGAKGFLMVHTHFSITV